MEVERNKWMWHCVNCKNLPPCEAEKRLMVWRDGKCVNLEEVEYE